MAAATKKALAASQTPIGQTPAGQIPVGFFDPATQPVELENPCRAQSKIEFGGPNGLFIAAAVTTRTIRVLFGGELTVVTYTLTLNPMHAIRGEVPNCTADGITYPSTGSKNIYAVAPAEYTRDSTKKVTKVKIAFIVFNIDKPASLSVRVKFEEGVGNTTNFNPKRKLGTLTFPVG